MHSIDIIKILAIGLCVAVVVWFFMNRHKEELSFFAQAKIAIIGLISNFFDTLGIGSFATIIAMRSMLQVMPDDVRLIGTMNIQAMVTALVQTLIFLHFIQLDIITLLVSLIMISLGGFVSGSIAVRIKTQLVHRIMLIAFIVTGALLLLSQLDILNINGHGSAIRGVKLLIFAIFMFVSGTLPAFGVGYYSLVKTSMFLFGVSPIVAFPIMASASSFQMPVTSVVFINKQKFYYKSTILLSIFGCLGVLVAAPLINMLDPHTLKWWLFIVVLYNIFTLSRSARQK